MSNDDLRIKAKPHSTVENQPVKPEDKTVEIKPAEILVGEELAQTPVSTSDVELDKTAEKRAENKKAEEDAAFADMDSIIAEITGEQIEAECEKIIEESQNLELTSTAQALHDATQKGFQGITSYGNLGSQFKSSEAFIPNLQEVANLEEAGGILADINTSEAQKRAAITLLKRIAPNSDIANYYSQILTLGKAKMNEQASQTVESKQKNNDSIKDNYQDVLDSEGIVSYALNGAICLVGGTTRGDVADSIKDENSKIAVLRETANKKDIKTFMKLYKDFTRVKFNVEKFQVLAKKEEEYQKAIAIKQGVALAKALEKNPYGVQIMRVMQNETELGERNYNFDMAKTDKPSPLQQALLTQFGGNQLLAALWINGNIENKNLAGKSQKEIYDSLVKEFVNNQNKMANEFFKDKSFENISSDYENALRSAYGYNIPQETLQRYIENQATAKGALQTGVLVACGMFAGPAALAILTGGITALDKGTSKNGFQNGDAESIMLEVALSYAGFKIFGAVSNTTMGKFATYLQKHPEYANQVIARLTSQASGGAAAGMFGGSVGAVLSGEKDIDKILLQGLESGAHGIGFALAFGAISECIHALKMSKSLTTMKDLKGGSLEMATKNLLSILDSEPQLKVIADEIRQNGLNAELLKKAYRASIKVYHTDNGSKPSKEVSQQLNELNKFINNGLKEVGDIKVSDEKAPVKSESPKPAQPKLLENKEQPSVKSTPKPEAEKVVVSKISDGKEAMTKIDTGLEMSDVGILDIAKEITSIPEEQNLIVKMLKSEVVHITEASERAIMKKQLDAFLQKNPNISKDSIYIYSPRPNGQEKSYTRSGKIFSDVNNIQANKIKTSLDEIPKGSTVFVVDDCSITGASMIMDTLATIKDFEGRIVFTPTVIGTGVYHDGLTTSPMADNILGLLSKLHTTDEATRKQVIETLKQYITDGKPKNIAALESLSEKTLDKISFELTDDAIPALSFKETETFKSLSESDKRKIDALFTRGGMCNGYHKIGTMVLMTDRTPNNNVGVLSLLGDKLHLATKTSGILDYGTILSLNKKGLEPFYGFRYKLNSHGNPSGIEIEELGVSTDFKPNVKGFNITIELPDGTRTIIRNYKPKIENTAELQNGKEHQYSFDVDAEFKNQIYFIKGKYTPRTAKKGTLCSYADVLIVPIGSKVVNLEEICDN